MAQTKKGKEPQKIGANDMDTSRMLCKILDGMADFETRISTLELSQPYPKEIPKYPDKVNVIDHKELYNKADHRTLQQLLGRLSYIENKITEVRAKKKGSYKYDIVKE